MDSGVGEGVTRVRRVLSDRAERATTQLMMTLAAHRRWRRTPHIPFGRLVVLRGPTAPRTIEHFTLPHLAAVGEEFARAALLEASEPLMPRDNDLLGWAWDRAENQAEQWAGVEDGWTKWHKIPIKGESRYITFKGVVDARNAIVHGLGHLTRKQTRGDGGAKVRASLALVGITTVGRKLEISDDSILTCVDAAREFIVWLDGQSVGKGLRPLRSAL
ncbi:MAG: hypothetical protein M3546_14850 [Actinomycetota bacterium]|nr:hypothetical protein [Actinomycetota bacterium]